MARREFGNMPVCRVPVCWLFLLTVSYCRECATIVSYCHVWWCVCVCALCVCCRYPALRCNIFDPWMISKWPIKKKWWWPVLTLSNNWLCNKFHDFNGVQQRRAATLLIALSGVRLWVLMVGSVGKVVCTTLSKLAAWHCKLAGRKSQWNGTWWDCHTANWQAGKVSGLALDGIITWQTGLSLKIQHHLMSGIL